MNFVNMKYFPHLMIGFFIFSIISIYFNKKYFNWIKEYWFFERTWGSRISSALYLLSFFIILLSLLDLRGPEEKILSNLPDQRTIIVLDSSMSMLAEDVRPSRYIKAIQMARHFVKSAAGHQVSIVLFSDTQKRLIPFTDDLDLIDSRLAALEKTNSVGGGSNISQAIAETLGYLTVNDEGKPSSGNILVFTDAEESEGEFDLDLGDNVNLALVGIGTAKGGNIPLRWEDGSFRGYKNQKGEPVISKLDENYIKKIGKSVKNYKYWITNSYSLPTEEILSFFRAMYKNSQNKGDQRIRPVLSHFILIPGIMLYCLSVLFGRMKTFKQVIIVLLCFVQFLSLPVKAETEEEKSKPIPKEIQSDLQKMKKGKATKDEILKIGEKFLKNDDLDRALPLYEEYAKFDDSTEVQFNHATTYLKSGNFEKALPIVKSILSSNAPEDVKDKMRNNVLNAMNTQNSQKQKSDKNKKNQDQKESDSKDNKGDDKSDDEKSKDGNSQDKDNSGKDKDKSKDDQQKDGKKQDDKQKNGQSDPTKKDNKSENGNDQDKENNKDNESKKDEPKELKAPPREQKLSTVEAKEKMIEQQRKMKKTPAMIKQIMSDDRELQKRMMDTSTKERGNQKQKRDW